VGEEKLSLFIDNDYTVLEAIFSSLQRPPIEVYLKMDPAEAAKLEAFRRNMSRTVLPLLGFARRIASNFPADAVESKVTPEWLLGKGRAKFPKLVEVVEKHGDKGRRWLEKQCREIVDYLLGRLAYDPKTGKMVYAGVTRNEKEKEE